MEQAGDIHIANHPAASNTLSQHGAPRWRSRDSLASSNALVFVQDQDVAVRKRKLPSPEGATRQSALPQPLTGKERWWSEEEEEEEEQRWSREGGLRQQSENNMNQEKKQAHQQKSLGKSRD